MDPATIVIRDLVTGPIPPRATPEGSPNTLRTRVAEVVDKMGPAPWSKRIIADERNLVTLIASAPGGGNRPHWHREFDEWWVVLAGRLQWELTGGVVVDATKDDIVWVPRGTVHHSEHRRRPLAASGGGDAARVARVQPVRAVRVQRRRAAGVVRLSGQP